MKTKPIFRPITVLFLRCHIIFSISIRDFFQTHKKNLTYPKLVYVYGMCVCMYSSGQKRIFVFKDPTNLIKPSTFEGNLNI